MHPHHYGRIGRLRRPPYVEEQTVFAHALELARVDAAWHSAHLHACGPELNCGPHVCPRCGRDGGLPTQIADRRLGVPNPSENGDAAVQRLPCQRALDCTDDGAFIAGGAHRLHSVRTHRCGSSAIIGFLALAQRLLDDAVLLVVERVDQQRQGAQRGEHRRQRSSVKPGAIASPGGPPHVLQHSDRQADGHPAPATDLAVPVRPSGDNANPPNPIAGASRCRSQLRLRRSHRKCFTTDACTNRNAVSAPKLTMVSSNSRRVAKKMMSPSVITATSSVARSGMPRRGCTRLSARGNRPSRAMLKNSRETAACAVSPAPTLARNTPAMERVAF